MSKITGKFYFIPSVESHYFNFFPICKNGLDYSFNAEMLVIKDVIPTNRDFKIKPLNNQTILKDTHDAVLYLNECFDNSSRIVIVGNDSEKKISPLLHKIRDIGYSVVLMQDGWLTYKNILNPVYSKKNKIYRIKKILHRLLVLNVEYFKKKYANLIGQNSDYFFVYSDIAKDNFIKAGITEERIFLTGSPRFDILPPLQTKILNNNVIALFLTVNNEHRTYHLIEIIAKIKSSLKSCFGDDYLFIIKPHPSDGSNYEEFIDDKTFIFRETVVELFLSYNIIFSFCFNSTVIFELMSNNIPFLQLMIYPFKSDSNFHPELPYVESLDALPQEIQNARFFDYKNVGSKYLINLNGTFNSISETISCLMKISQKQKIDMY